MMQLVIFWMIVASIKLSECLNHGRDAKLGEFPYIVRIQVKEDMSNFLEWIGDTGDGHVVQNASERTEVVATGVLITSTRIVTTCGSVGNFIDSSIRLFNLSRVSIMAGSVLSTGHGGQTKQPNSSHAHPLCYSLLVSKVILFNYGIYTISEPFSHPFVKPIVSLIHTKRNLERSLRSKWEGRAIAKCITAGWGSLKKQFQDDVMPDYFERYADVLQTTSLEIVDYQSCFKSTCIHFRNCLTSFWEWGFVCAKAIRGGPCLGDEGAPLVCSGQLYAIHTNPQKCEDGGIPRQFLRIDLELGYVFDVKDGSTNCKAQQFVILLTSVSLTFWGQL